MHYILICHALNVIRRHYILILKYRNNNQTNSVKIQSAVFTISRYFLRIYCICVLTLRSDRLTLNIFSLTIKGHSFSRFVVTADHVFSLSLLSCVPSLLLSDSSIISSHFVVINIAELASNHSNSPIFIRTFSRRVGSFINNHKILCTFIMKLS